MKIRYSNVLVALLLACSGAPVLADAAPCTGVPPFSADAAWREARSELAANYAYWDRIDADAAFEAATPAMLASPDRLVFADRLQTLLLLFRDSHLHVTPTSTPSAAWVPSAADFWLEQRADKLLVRDVKGASEAARLGLRPGWQLLAMDGADPAETARLRFAALGIRPDQAQLLYAINSLASGYLDRPRRFTFLAGGRRRTVDLPPGYDSVRRPATLLTVGTTRDAAGHPVVTLRINNSMGRNELIAAFDAAVVALPAQAHVIIDMRDTPSGGNSTVARAMMSHFIDHPQPYQRHELTAERKQFGVARAWLEFVEPRAPYHSGRVIVLAGLWTGSMGEGITIGFNAAARALVVGSQMGQLLGAMIDDELPASCLRVSFANERLWHVNGLPREDFLPEIILPGADTARDGSDPALAGAMAQIGEWDAAPPAIQEPGHRHR